MFSPHVLPIVMGTTVEWPNNDDILHNVFSVSDARPFDLDLYKAPVIKSVLFEKPGRKKGQAVGRSPYLQSVHVEGAVDLIGEIRDVRIDAVGPNSLKGTLLDSFASVAWTALAVVTALAPGAR